LLSLLLIASSSSSAQVPFGAQVPAYEFYVRIDCGGSTDFTNSVNQTWESDRLYSGGEAANVSHPQNFAQEQERTLRFFPVAQGKKNCYQVQVPIGRHYISMFFVYDNYDLTQHSPSFDVSVEGTVVFSWRSPWLESTANSGAYSDLYAFIHDGSATVCFYSISTDSPVIGSLELLQVDPLSYASNSTGQNVILVNYGRLTAGNSSFGPGFDNVTTDLGGRSWEVDDNYSDTPKAVLTTQQNISLANVAPNYWPVHLYQACRYVEEPGAPLLYTFQVDAQLDYQIWLHFAEIDPNITKPGERVFNVSVNNEVAFEALDIFKTVGGGNAALDLLYTVHNLTGDLLNVTLTPVDGSPLICGLEILALLPSDIATNATQALAMHALKQSLSIPERMGWNGDPCAPTVWDAWQGVTCNLAADGSSLIITQMDISGQGLTGILTTEFNQLAQLNFLNVSNNQLQGSIPAGLGLNSLVNVDLSSNLLSGPIPSSLGSPQLRHLRLDNNHLTGAVPETVYAIGVNGGFLNLTYNSGLCGVPSLPDCEPQGPSAGAIIGIILGLIVGVILIAVAIYYYIQFRKSQEDYNFNLPHQLVERTKWYQQHKMTKNTEGEGVAMMNTVIPNRFGFSSNIHTNQ